MAHDNFVGNIADELREKCRVAFKKYQDIYDDLHFEAEFGLKDVANDKYVELLKKEGYEVIFCDVRDEGGEDNTTTRTLLRKDNNFYFISPNSWVIEQAVESGEVVKIGDYNYPPLRVEKDNQDLIARAVTEDRIKRLSLNLTEAELLEEARKLPSY